MTDTLPVQVNGRAVTVPAGTTVAGLIALQGLAGRRIAIERNQSIVPRSEHDTTALLAGDIIEIVHAIGGG